MGWPSTSTYSSVPAFTAVESRAPAVVVPIDEPSCTRVPLLSVNSTNWRVPELSTPAATATRGSAPPTASAAAAHPGRGDVGDEDVALADADVGGVEGVGGREVRRGRLSGDVDVVRGRVQGDAPGDVIVGPAQVGA